MITCVQSLNSIMCMNRIIFCICAFSTLQFFTRDHACLKIYTYCMYHKISEAFIEILVLLCNFLLYDGLPTRSVRVYKYEYEGV